MREIIEEIWHGNIAPQKRKFIRGTDYEDALIMMCRNEEKLKAMMESKEQEVFEKFCCCRDEVDQYTQSDIFVAGFRLGARIIIETFCEKDGFFAEGNKGVK